MEPVKLSLDDVKQWFSVDGAVQHALNLLNTQGEKAIDAVRQIFVGIEALTRRDLFGVFAALNKVHANVSEIVSAIKAEFNVQ